MPAGALYQIPTSLNRDGKLKTNLRGILAPNAIDYADTSRVITATDIRQTTVSGGGAWSNSIQWAYENTREDSDGLLQYSSLLSSATTFTLLFRFKLKTPTVETPNVQQVLFFNGLLNIFAFPPLLNGYAIIYDSSNNVLRFDPLGVAPPAQLSSGTLTQGIWYHYGLKVTTPVDISGATIIDVWENGTPLAPIDLGVSISTPTGGTSLFSIASPPQPVGFHGFITDFVLLEGTELTNEQMVAFAEAPYI